MGRLIRALFELQPELLDGIERPLSLGELDEFDDIAAVRNRLVEDVIRSVLRESHLKQLGWLAERLKMTLDSDPELLGRFGIVASVDSQNCECMRSGGESTTVRCGARLPPGAGSRALQRVRD